MSIIFGIKKEKDRKVEEPELRELSHATDRYASDGTFIRLDGPIGMGFQPYYTHQRSGLEFQPAVSECGMVLTFDGRLDNYVELACSLDLSTGDTSDSQIVLAAYRRWGELCFAKFIGDWALALWSPTEQAVYLARDHAGTRSLYYRNVSGTLQWSTYLETFIGDGSPCSLDERYVACHLGQQPVRDLTPYKNIRAVPPAHYLAIRDDRVTKKSHWDWMVKEKIRYQSDEDYEEHFLSLLKQSVERRTVLGAPILAELSGGMDSASIVCVSDSVRRSQDIGSKLLDTLSFYDDSEPNWNERPYFSIVEARRRKTGIHVETSFLDYGFEPSGSSLGAYLLPGADSLSVERERNFNCRLDGCGYRVILSGVGGDEVLGGISIPSPELADYLLSGNLAPLIRRATAWCLVDRSPLAHMLFNTIRFTGGIYRESHIDKGGIAPWIQPRLQNLCLELARTAGRQNRRIGVSPSAISNGLTWWSMMETLPHLYPAVLARREYRYPYLDRDLVDFLFRIPREQLVRPGRRRSLMRRALKDIVPVEIVERRRKANVVRGPLLCLQYARTQIEELLSRSLAVAYGYIDPIQIRSACDSVTSGKETRWSMSFMRTIRFELWLRARSVVSAIESAA
jgi:asparagine synthase (glutamine-hydrolysing)